LRIAPTDPNFLSASSTSERSKREVVMPEYRAYSITGDNHIDQAAIVITADDDDQAIQLALPLVNGHDVELWEGARRVTRLKSGAK
jgi:hypothetical protein